MLVFRSAAFGMLCACFMMLADLPRELRERERDPGSAQVASQAPPPQAAIVDVAGGVGAAQLGALVKLAPDEHVVAIDDRRVDGDLEAGAALATSDARPGGYVDLTVRGAAGSRRVLVLLH
jgi:hypothetical protein